MCGSHWIVVSNVNCEPSTVDVYDSAYAYIDNDTKQICSFFRPVGDVLKLRMPNTQCQLNSFSCGVLAIATATKLTLGKDPLLCYWDTPQMRCDLIQRLEQGKMESFSQKTVSTKIYCICRMPNQTSKAMVMCDWYLKKHDIGQTTYAMCLDSLIFISALCEETYTVPNSSNTVNMQDFKLVLDKLLWGRKWQKKWQSPKIKSWTPWFGLPILCNWATITRRSPALTTLLRMYYTGVDIPLQHLNSSYL